MWQFNGKIRFDQCTAPCRRMGTGIRWQRQTAYERILQRSCPFANDAYAWIWRKSETAGLAQQENLPV